MLVSRLRQGKVLLLADGGNQPLQIVFNEDVAQVVLAAHAKPSTFGQIYNCANPELLTGRQYFEIMAGLLDVPLRVRNLPSDIIADSSWGWDVTMVPRVLSMDALKRDVGIVPETPAHVAIGAALSHILKRSQVPTQNEPASLARVEQVLQGLHSRLKPVLEQCAIERHRTPVDTRMNGLPPDRGR